MIALLLTLLANGEPPRIVVTTNPLPSGPTVDCRTGPAERTLGGTAWHVFACTDRSLTILARKGNPAFPAMMSVRVRDGETDVSGPNYVLKQASEAADELRKLSPEAIARLHAEATAVGRR